MTPMKKCRVCDRDYEPCHSTRFEPGVFRWREVACSPECGAIYLRRVQESRGLLPKEEKVSKKRKKTQIVEDEIVTNSEEVVNTLEPDRV